LASIELTGLWLALVSDLETQLHFTQVSIEPTYGVRGGLRHYANGVVRFITSSGKDRSVDVEIREVSRPDRETLEAWYGELALLRDSRGRILFGVFPEISAPERQGSAGICDVSFTFGATTHSIEV
jgi:hypothetical protein